MRRWGVIIWAVTCIACGGKSSNIPHDPPEAPTAVAEDQFVVSASGLKHYDLVVGSGAEAVKGKKITVHYAGWLTSGKMFDSSIAKKRPFSLTLGGGQVIKGWDEGIVGMRTGGHRQLVIPADLAYGPDGYANVIPPNATLIFEVYLDALE